MLRLSKMVGRVEKMSDLKVVAIPSSVRKEKGKVKTIQWETIKHQNRCFFNAFRLEFSNGSKSLFINESMLQETEERLKHLNSFTFEKGFSKVEIGRKDSVSINTISFFQGETLLVTLGSKRKVCPQRKYDIITVKNSQSVSGMVFGFSAGILTAFALVFKTD